MSCAKGVERHVTKKNSKSGKKYINVCRIVNPAVGMLIRPQASRNIEMYHKIHKLGQERNQNFPFHPSL